VVRGGVDRHRPPTAPDVEQAGAGLVGEPQLLGHHLVLAGLGVLQAGARPAEPSAGVRHRRPEHEGVEVVADVVVVADGGGVPLAGVPTTPGPGLLFGGRERRAERSGRAGGGHGARRQAEGQPGVEGDGIAEQDQGVEDVPLEVEVAHDVGPGQPDLVRRPEEPSQGIGRADPEDPRAVERPDGAAVPQLHSDGQPGAEHGAQQRPERPGHRAVVPLDVDLDVVRRAWLVRAITGGKGHVTPPEAPHRIPSRQGRRADGRCRRAAARMSRLLRLRY
jgi:hypothetical protein